MAQEAQPQHKWRMATSWPGGELLDLSKLWAARVEELTQGRIKIQVFPGGTLGNPLKVSESVKNGVADVGHTWASYDWGRDKTGALLGGWPAGPDAEAMFHWLYEYGGQELFQEFRLEKFGVMSFVAGVSTPEVFLHSKKPVKTLADLQGLKMRAAGAWLELSQELGAASVTASGSEVYQMLERGNIEATEWANPGVNLPMGLHQVAPYLIMPGYHQPEEVFDVVINRRKWDQLSDQDKMLVERASKLVSYEYWTLQGRKDIEAMEEYEKAGVEIIILEPDVGVEIRKIANAWADKEAETNEWFKKVLTSQREFIEIWDKRKSTRTIRP